MTDVPHSHRSPGNAPSTADLRPPGAQPRPSRWGRWLRWIAGSLLVVMLIARLTVQDRLPFFSTLFYAAPLPVLTALAAGLVLASGRSRRACVTWSLVSGVLCLWTLAEYRRSVPPTVLERPIRLLLWNTGRGTIGSPDGIAREITRVDADLVVLIEAVPWEDPPEIRAFWKEACPQYRTSLLGGGIVLLSKFPSGETTTAELPLSTRTRQLDVDCRGTPLRILVCDVGSNPFRSRKPTLDAITAAADKLADSPALVLGDFNTPHDSRCFDGLRKSYRNAFLTAGSGYLATWPIPLPVLSLDQIWASDRIALGTCRHLWTTRSDHRPVLLEFDVK